MNVAIVGARDRSSLKDRFDSKDLKNGKVPKDDIDRVLWKDRELIERVIDNLIKKFGFTTAIITVGCDDGIGMIVKETAIAKKVGFVEVSVHFHGEKRPRPDYTKFYLARNATILELAEIAVILSSPTGKQSVIDGIVERIKKDSLPQTFAVIDDGGLIVEKNTEDLEYLISK